MLTMLMTIIGSGKSTLLEVIADHGGGEKGGSTPYYVLGSGKVGGVAAGAGGRVLLVKQDALVWSSVIGGGRVDLEEDEIVSLPIGDAIDLAIALGDDDAVEDEEAWRSLVVAASESLGWDLDLYQNTPIELLSPGCALRAYVGIAMAKRGVDLLLLDEVSNHLDLPSRLWLIGSLKASGKTCLLVSHDAPFLDAVCDHLWALDPRDGSITVSGVSYSTYVARVAAERAAQAAAYDSAVKRKATLTAAAEKLKDASSAGARAVAKDKDKLQRDFRRDRAGRSGRKAKSLEKLRDSVPVGERPVDRKPLQIALSPLGAGYDSSLVASDVVLGFEDGHPLPLPPVSVRVDFGERIAIVGGNGLGKSTLLATLTGRLSPLSGSVSVGRDLVVGNLMQEHEDLPRDMRVREYFCTLQDGLSVLEARNAIIRYGLTLAQAEGPIGALNPGARARLLLATFSLRSVNTLILDEVSNHLDEEAVAELTATLNTYAGTVIAVSHDVAFLESLDLTRVFALDPSVGLLDIPSLEEYVGDVGHAVDEVVETVWG